MSKRKPNINTLLKKKKDPKDILRCYAVGGAVDNNGYPAAFHLDRWQKNRQPKSNQELINEARQVPGPGIKYYGPQSPIGSDAQKQLQQRVTGRVNANVGLLANQNQTLQSQNQGLQGQLQDFQSELDSFKDYAPKQQYSDQQYNELQDKYAPLQQQFNALNAQNYPAQLQSHFAQLQSYAAQLQNWQNMYNNKPTGPSVQELEDISRQKHFQSKGLGYFGIPLTNDPKKDFLELREVMLKKYPAYAKLF